MPCGTLKKLSKHKNNRLQKKYLQNNKQNVLNDADILHLIWFVGVLVHQVWSGQSCEVWVCRFLNFLHLKDSYVCKMYKYVSKDFVIYIRYKKSINTEHVCGRIYRLFQLTVTAESQTQTSIIQYSPIMHSSHTLAAGREKWPPQTCLFERCSNKELERSPFSISPWTLTHPWVRAATSNAEAIGHITYLN